MTLPHNRLVWTSTFKLFRAPFQNSTSKSAENSNVRLQKQLHITQGGIHVGLIFHDKNDFIGLDWHPLACFETSDHLAHLTSKMDLECLCQIQSTHVLAKFK
ncbi:hypothetical protein AC1031_014081 [Aphanomyces cochlioides]|nr:hypothetical protein AC1031_014081 [Aphanomyces cochlioides]